MDFISYSATVKILHSKTSVQVGKVYRLSVVLSVNFYISISHCPCLLWLRLRVSLKPVSGPVLGMVAVTLWFLMVSDDVTTTLDLGNWGWASRNPATMWATDRGSTENPGFAATS